MTKTKTTSSARSEGGATTPKRKSTRGSRSLCSPALSTASGKLTSLIDQFKDKNMESFALSPLNGRSVLNDNTEIDEPKRKSWWKKLDESSQDVMEVLEDNRLTVNNVIEEFTDLEVLSLEKINYTLDLPESSDNESIKSIVVPQRRLFTQKENQPQKVFGHLMDNRESLAKLHKTNTTNNDNTVNVGTRELFRNAKRSKPIFPAGLLNISPNKTAADKTRENALADAKPQVRNLFGNRPANKRKNMFADFIVSESEDEIPEIQPKVFGFQKKLEQRRISSISKGRDASPWSSITTDIEMDFRMLLASSTMVENQLEDNMLADNTPIKQARLSKLSEAKESEAGTLQTNTISDKTKQSNKSIALPEVKDKSLSSSRTTRSMLKNASKCEESVNTSVKQDAKGNKSRSKISSKGVSPSKSDTDKQNVTLNKSQKQNKNRTTNIPKAIETEMESEENVNVVNQNKSTNRSLPNTTTTNISVNESQEIEEEEGNKIREAEEEANESQEINDEADESQFVVDHVSDMENDEGMDEDEEEAANASEVNEASENESQEVENEASENESQEVENDEQESHEVAGEAESEVVEDDQQIHDSDSETDKAIASDPEISDDNQADEMEVDGDEEQESDNESEQNEHESLEENQIEEQSEIEPSEEIEESPNVTHDTTGRHRKKHLNKSPEVILKDKINQIDSFTVEGRNTSVRKTKSMIKNLNIRPSLAPPRDSTGFSDGTKNSSAEGSGWDSHRVTRKTLRQTFGKDFTPRKSLRALVMEKSAKRQTEHMEMHPETLKFPLANSTEMPEDSNHHVEDIVESDDEVSRRTQLPTLAMQLQKLREQNMEMQRKVEAEVRNSLKTPVINSLNIFKVPNKPAPRQPKPIQRKPKKQWNSIIPFDYLPPEMIEDLKYKPPKRFQPANAEWITKRLYKFLENKLEAKYNYKSRVRAEKLVEQIYNFTRDLRRHRVAPTDAVDVLKHEFARLEIVHTHFEFYNFFHEFMPREVRIKVVPDIINKIGVPRHGVFADILTGETVHR